MLRGFRPLRPSLSLVDTSMSPPVYLSTHRGLAFVISETVQKIVIWLSYAGDLAERALGMPSIDPRLSLTRSFLSRTVVVKM